MTDLARRHSRERLTSLSHWSSKKHSKGVVHPTRHNMKRLVQTDVTALRSIADLNERQSPEQEWIKKKKKPTFKSQTALDICISGGGKRDIDSWIPALKTWGSWVKTETECVPIPRVCLSISHPKILLHLQTKGDGLPRVQALMSGYSPCDAQVEMTALSY